jgi:phosphoribosylglycinamide formyltransferase-1
MSARQCKARLAKICDGLPETGQRPGGEGGRHVAYMVRNKTFAYFTDDHHGDGRLALICKAPPGEQPALIASGPLQFFVPPYLGHRGWVGLWLDRRDADWEEVVELMTEAYRLTAPKRLVALLG